MWSCESGLLQIWVVLPLLTPLTVNAAEEQRNNLFVLEVTDPYCMFTTKSQFVGVLPDNVRALARTIRLWSRRLPRRNRSST